MLSLDSTRIRRKRKISVMKQSNDDAFLVLLERGSKDMVG
jgi:hypothetical protein